MAEARLEHVNITVRNPDETAALLADLFGWHVRWHGPARDGGRTVHVGGGASYVALFTLPGETLGPDYFRKGYPLNHVAVEVDDLDAVEQKVILAGLTPFAHADYAPGRRFYFLDPDGIEYEVLSYAETSV